LYYKVSMKAIKPIFAFAELLLVIPAALFMMALFLREVQPLAQTGRLVDWFSHHVVLGLYIFLFGMPLTAFVAGGAFLMRGWQSDSEFRRASMEMLGATRKNVVPLVIAGTTVMAASILAIVAMHMLTE
jgi:cytochrome b561